MTTELDVWSHHAGTKDVYQTRHDMKANNPVISPQIV
jgi:hypothetical protein